MDTYSAADLLPAVDALISGMVSVVFIMASVVIGLCALRGSARQTTGDE